MNPDNQATMVVRNGPLLGPVLTRVIGMLAARAQCPVDRLDDALLVADAIAAHAPAHSANGGLTVRVLADDDALEVTVANLRPDGGAGLLSDATLPAVGNVLERIASDVRVETGASESVVVRLRFAA